MIAHWFWWWWLGFEGLGFPRPDLIEPCLECGAVKSNQWTQVEPCLECGAVESDHSLAHFCKATNRHPPPYFEPPPQRFASTFKKCFNKIHTSLPYFSSIPVLGLACLWYWRPPADCSCPCCTSMIVPHLPVESDSTGPFWDSTLLTGIETRYLNLSYRLAHTFKITKITE